MASPSVDRGKKLAFFKGERACLASAQVKRSSLKRDAAVGCLERERSDIGSLTCVDGVAG